MPPWTRSDIRSYQSVVPFGPRSDALSPLQAPSVDLGTARLEPGAPRKRWFPDVTVVIDRFDDIRISNGVLEYCTPLEHRVAVAPGPGSYTHRGLTRNISDALAEGTVDHRAPSLKRHWLPFKSPRVREAADLSVLAGPANPWKTCIRELFILRAHMFDPELWEALGQFAKLTSVHVGLVVHGREPTRRQMAALDGCNVETLEGDCFHFPLPPNNPAVPEPWWSPPTTSGGGGCHSTVLTVGQLRKHVVGKKEELPADVSTYAWKFKAHRTFGWRPHQVAQWVKQAVREIIAMELVDPILAADGAVTALERIPLALETVRDSAGAVVIAVSDAVDRFASLIATVNVPKKVRHRWLERLWSACHADDDGWLAGLGDHWGELCASEELASQMADGLLSINRQYPGTTRQWFFHESVCLSSLYFAGRFQEILDIVPANALVTYARWADRAHAALIG